MDLFHNPSSLKPNRFETAIWVSKLVIMSMGIVSILVLLKVAIIPCTFDLVLSTLPRLWVSARSWITLPFLYVIVNFIILTIAASSNFFPHKSSSTSSNPIPFSSTVLDTATYITEPEEEHETKEPKEEVEKEVVIEEMDQEEEEEEKGILKDSVFTFNKFIPDDPSPENCTNDYFLPDSSDNDDDTLEATWRAIMEGQGKTMKPQLKKSDTWAARIVKAEPFRNNGKRGGGGGGEDPVAWAQKELKKSDTFNDRASLRREKSMSPEELALRSEAFIKNFNNQMKLQRLESYQRFKEMVTRGRV